jgi:hypothetical protein
MPFYYFDLLVNGTPHAQLVNGTPHAQGGMILEDLAIASDRADALASELRLLKPELLFQQSFVRSLTRATMKFIERRLTRSPAGPPDHRPETSKRPSSSKVDSRLLPVPGVTFLRALHASVGGLVWLPRERARGPGSAPVVPLAGLIGLAQLRCAGSRCRSLS